jgi:hypothetical protein
MGAVWTHIRNVFVVSGLFLLIGVPSLFLPGGLPFKKQLERPAISGVGNTPPPSRAAA